METIILSQFLWGKLLIDHKKESGYKIIGSSSNIDPGQLYPEKVLIGHPFLEIYDVISHTLTRARNPNYLLWSYFYYRISDQHWAEWNITGNRPFIMEYHIVVPKNVFLKLRFVLGQLESNINHSRLDKTYYEYQELENINLELPDEITIVDQIENRLKTLNDNSKEAALELILLNSYSKNERVVISNCDLNDFQRVELLRTILAILPDKDSVEYSICLGAFLKSDTSLFDATFIYDDVPPASLSGNIIDYRTLTTDKDRLQNGFGTLILDMVSFLGIKKTAEFMRQTTHKLDGTVNNEIDKLRFLYTEIILEAKLDQGTGTIEELQEYIRKKGVIGITRYKNNIRKLFGENRQLFIRLLKNFPAEILNNGFRENFWGTLDQLNLEDFITIANKAELRGTLSRNEINILSNWLIQKYRIEVFSIADRLESANSISSSEKRELDKRIFQDVFDATLFMHEIVKNLETDQLLDPNNFLSDQAKEHVLFQSYEYLYKNTALPHEFIVTNTKFIIDHIEWFQQLVLLTIKHNHYGFFTSELMGLIYRYYWLNNQSKWDDFLVRWNDSPQNRIDLNVWTIILFLNEKYEKEKTREDITGRDPKLVIDTIYQIIQYFGYLIDLNERIYRIFYSLRNIDKSYTIDLWLSCLPQSDSYFNIGKYLLEAYFQTIEKENDFFRTIRYIQYFKNYKNTFDLYVLYLNYLPHELLDKDPIYRINWLKQIADKLREFGSPDTIYYQLARKVGQDIEGTGVDLIPFHTTMLHQLSSSARREYIRGIPSSILLKIDFREYLNSINSIPSEDKETVISVLNNLLDSQADPIEFAEVINQVLLYCPNEKLTLEIIDKIVVNRHPLYFLKVRGLLALREASLERLANELFIRSVRSFYSKGGNIEELVTPILQQEHDDLALIYYSLADSSDQNKKGLYALKKILENTRRLMIGFNRSRLKIRKSRKNESHGKA